MNRNTLRILAFVFLAFMAIPAWAEDTTVTLSLDGNPSLALTAPAAAKVISSNGYVNIKTTNMSLHVWVAPRAATAKDALPDVPELIKGEFVKFKTKDIKDVGIAGAPAKHVFGSGNEADDGDPGNAEVVLFVVGGRVFAGCVHGEFDDAARASAPMMAVLRTARKVP